ncbi:MAG: capsular biosynthesis protein, partial [Bacteroidales bacterium]|nr:capsular biosynthesis protein [Bacteroidales bacterium]
MSIFCRKTAFAKSGFFNGFTDWHCHILPGVDDGFKTIEDSLAALSEYEKAGVQAVWLTPHIMEDMPNTVEKLQKRFEDL